MFFGKSRKQNEPYDMLHVVLDHLLQLYGHFMKKSKTGETIILLDFWDKFTILFAQIPPEIDKGH